LEKFFLANEGERKQIEAEISSREWEFQQWEATNNNDSGSESNPSEDEFSPAERKDKVMSELHTNRKTIGKKKKNKKKKSVTTDRPINHTEVVALKPVTLKPPSFRHTTDRI